MKWKTVMEIFNFVVKRLKEGEMYTYGAYTRVCTSFGN